MSFSIEKITIPCSYRAPFVLSNLCTPTKPRELARCKSCYFPGNCCKWAWPIQAPNISGTKSLVRFPLRRAYQIISPGPRHVFMFRNKASFYGEELSAPHLTPSWRTTPCRVSVTSYSI